MSDLSNTTAIDLLSTLPVAAYATDSEGLITFYNDAASQLWGLHPELGTARWCGAWRLYWPDGRLMPPGECPLGVSLREGKAVQGFEAVAERPDGTRVSFLPHLALLRSDTGEVIGAINLMLDITAQKADEIDLERLAAIVSSSDDAIISKTLEGRVTSWNTGATRIFGYEPEEMIGQPIMRIIPAELQHEEADILARLRRGERIEHFDTVRLAKDGRRIDISLTVSPLRDRAGLIVGASKVARDVSERKRDEEMQRLLFNELDHRVKNTLATVQAIASQSLPAPDRPEAFAANFNERVQALSQVHDLIVQGQMRGADVAAIVREQVFHSAPDAASGLTFSGPHVMVDTQTSIELALVLHELAANARKHGALAVETGKLHVAWSIQPGADRTLLLEWKETGVPNTNIPGPRGFGMNLIERSLQAGGGGTNVQFGADGLSCEIRVPLLPAGTESPESASVTSDGDFGKQEVKSTEIPLKGTRILVVEDEVLVAMDIEAQLTAAGCETVGPATTVEKALRMILEEPFDAALLDANLNGNPVDAIAEALTDKGIPFAFATGYGREGLPARFRQTEMIRKPFGTEQLLATLRYLFDSRRMDAGGFVKDQ